MNRLLINMKNKIEVLKGAIKMCDRLDKGEVIKLNGLNNLSVSAKENSHVDLMRRKNELIEEVESLYIRVKRMDNSY
jgi:hypothetical protein